MPKVTFLSALFYFLVLFINDFLLQTDDFECKGQQLTLKSALK